MDKQTQQLTVADLDAAKHGLLNHTNLTTQDKGVAATCIGIVEEIVKCQRSDVCDHEWDVNTSHHSVFAKTDDGNFVSVSMSRIQTREHIVALHNLWLKAVAAFGGEVK